MPLAPRPGVTLIELLVVCTLIALTAGVAIPRTRSVLDGIRIRQAAHEVSGAVTLTRAAALRRGEQARLIFDQPRATLHIESAGDTLLRRDLQRLHHVNLRATRDTITYSPSGMGFGVANSTIIVSLGQRAETVTVSRLGRARRSY